MYKVMIIDDETIIVKGLTKVIPWQDYGCEVVATAYNAQDGAKTIREISPDILFTDIRMPGGDGLTMLAGLITEFPNMQITVLTGHRDFNYAQEAIRLGVTRFLLKPSKMDELTEALTTMTAKLKNLKQSSPLQTNGEGEQPAAEKPSAEQSSQGESSSFIVRKAVAFIEEHHAEKISLSDVADACYVSQWHLSKLLGKFTGQSFYDILNTARITHTKELMTDPSLNLSEIADIVGFSDTPHFSRVFKKIEGISANTYRNSKMK
ncbi:MAG: response regulator [Clostridiales bacterium]|jgi:YesN/AraC family two-component response regulator|nr:response regulator [Clostridiales bacterium]